MTIHVIVSMQNRDTSLEDHARERVLKAIGRFESRVKDVEVRIREHAADRGEREKGCDIDARLDPRGELHISATSKDAYVAVLKAVRRLDQALAKEIDRLHTHRHIRHDAEVRQRKGESELPLRAD